ncbi:hypothetical protein [Pseudomonas gingeri]|uniref:Uncharacterized protein n=1 Tax=Pseudomonas gingeri TaxID=117681 RepID=A0A7Y7YF99_9PSED|nr:hypothetical protein [Pseudomonas gingeri]NWB27886.1 hypothetical protein [Pseudomonas gingeri]NWC35409.1 hypothetical protein [Pseudomonas gingeri]NWD04511.1 hypothetical protein [Pseudomonas gingeri]NWE31122.1 hypothetical protein [Pseudomonas gingeri]NWE59184.1 hypothetical protein [Pseudomonas gingeri]
MITSSESGAIEVWIGIRPFPHICRNTWRPTAFKTVDGDASPGQPLFSIQPAVTARVALTQVLQFTDAAGE